MTNSEMVTIYRDREGKIHEKPEGAARSNLMKILFKYKEKKRGFIQEMDKTEPKTPNSAIMEFMEVMILEHWITKRTTELEGMLHDYITDSRPSDKGVTKP